MHLARRGAYDSSCDPSCRAWVSKTNEPGPRQAEALDRSQHTEIICVSFVMQICKVTMIDSPLEFWARGGYSPAVANFE